MIWHMDEREANGRAILSMVLAMELNDKNYLIRMILAFK